MRRTGRDLELYQRFFGPDLGVEPELILDIGAGDAKAGWHISEWPQFGATVVRADSSYHTEPPVKSSASPAVAADALNLPFQTNTFDRVISSWMFIHLGRERSATALIEIMRVLKDGHEAMIDPVRPFDRLHETMARRYRSPFRLFPFAMVITKPEGFSEWEPEHQKLACWGLAACVAWFDQPPKPSLHKDQ